MASMRPGDRPETRRCENLHRPPEGAAAVAGKPPFRVRPVGSAGDHPAALARRDGAGAVRAGGVLRLRRRARRALPHQRARLTRLRRLRAAATRSGGRGAGAPGPARRGGRGRGPGRTAPGAARAGRAGPGRPAPPGSRGTVGPPTGPAARDRLARTTSPTDITGLLLATEWLDNVPLDVAVHTPAGWRLLLVNPRTGEETVGPAPSPADTTWLTHWWPPAAPPTAPVIKEFVAAEGPDQDTNSLINAVGGGEGGGGVGGRVEIGWARDLAWAGAVGRVARGLALAVDYGHLRDVASPGRDVDRVSGWAAGAAGAGRVVRRDGARRHGLGRLRR